ncbi:MAG: hypothetical protein QOI66_5360 [Myxococcales bacterium]|jgi:hypothetical protein|nr:hypothetical protein [Myxococcales bacterium]
MSSVRLFALGLAAWILAGCGRYLEIGQRAIEPVTDGGIEAVPSSDTADTSGAPADATDQAPGETEVGGVLWQSNLETGDLSEWDRGGHTVGGTYQQRVMTSVSTEQAHSGSHAIKISFDTSDGASDHMAEFYRRVEPGPAYYSAWFFIDGAHVPGVYWTVLYFFYEKTPGDSTSRHGLWDVNLEKTNPYFYNETNQKSISTQPTTPYPVGKWFHLEAYFAYQPERNGQIQVWLDGVQILDAPNLGPATNDNLYWGIGSDTDKLTPSACTIYVDDAVVSTKRIGP